MEWGTTLMCWLRLMVVLGQVTPWADNVLPFIVYLFIYRPMCDPQQTIVLLRSSEIYAAPPSFALTLNTDKEKREG